jgi:hypothetical protein
MRVAIFGLHPDSQASYSPEDWGQVWRMAHDPLAPQAHRIFEAHSEPIARKYGGEAYLAKLAEYEADGLLTRFWPNECVAESGLSDAQSSIAWMFCHALRLAPLSIGLFGVDMADGEEYGYQRPNMAYLIGWASATNVKVHIDPASSLLKSQWTAGIYGHPDNINDMVYRLT